MADRQAGGVSGPARADSRGVRVVVLAAALLAIATATGSVAASPIAERKAPAAARTPGPTREAPMAVTVVPRSRARSGALRDTALVYLDGRIDADAPRRLSEALDGVDGKIAVWLNSPGGNLFAGMQLGRIIRERGAATYIVDPRTLLPGTCYSACAMTFLGGVYRFNTNGARYGVHRASLLVGPSGDRDLGQDLSAAIGSYIREMGVDARLLDLCMKADRDDMYVLSRQEARALGVVNNGRQPPEWSRTAFAGGTLLQGQQVTVDGTGQVSFSCDEHRTVFGVVHESSGAGEPGAARAAAHLLTIGRHERIPLSALTVSDREGAVRSTFILPPNLVRLAMSARHVGYQMKRSTDRSPAVDYRVDIDDRSASMVRKFLGDCLRGRAK